MSSSAISSFFRPKGVAVWSPPDRGEAIPLLARNLLAGGYKGRIVLLGPGPLPPRPLERITDPASIGPGCDLLLFKGDIAELTGRMIQMGGAGVMAVVVYSPPPAVDSWREDLLAVARKAGLRLAGPGSWGVVNTASGLAATADSPAPVSGGLALVTQSKVVCSYCLAEAARRGIGLGLVMDLGGEADLTQDEVLDHLANHYQAKALALHLGRVSRPSSFVSAALAAARQKPVFVLKAGESLSPGQPRPAGAFPVPTPEEAWDAILRRAGVHRVETLDALLTTGDLAARLGARPGPGVLVISGSKGAAGLALDALCRHGLTPAVPEEKAVRALSDLGCRPAGQNGLALLGSGTDEELLRAVAAVCLRAKGVDALLSILSPDPDRDPRKLIPAMGLAAADCGAREPKIPAMFVWPKGPGPWPEGAPAKGLILFDSPEKAVEAYAGLLRYHETICLAEEVPRRPLGRFRPDSGAAVRLLENAVKSGAGGLQLPERLELLGAYCLPVLPAKRVDSPDEFKQAAEAWGYPCRLVLVPRSEPGVAVSRELSREVGAGSQITRHWHKLHQRASGLGLTPEAVLARPCLGVCGPMLMMGWHRHPELGPLVVFGRGGRGNDSLADRTWCPAPLNHAQARAMMARTRVFARATGEDNPERVWPSVLEEMLIKLARMAQDLPQAANLNLNPVIISDRMAWITDAEVELAPGARPGGNGLILSPYPEVQEATALFGRETQVLVRPVRPEDADLVRELFSRLSPESVHSRFFRDIPELTSRMLVALTQIDYDREIALAAVLTHGLKEKLLGLCSLAARPGSEWAEFSVVVRDSWQRKGIGRLLMTRMAEIARSRGQLKIMGLVQRNNRAMIQLGRELGFSIGSPMDELVELKWEMDPEKS